MTADHSSYEDIAAPRRGSQEYQEGYAEARRAFLIGRAVRERRLAVGLSQVELATRADMTQPRSHGWKRAASSPRFPAGTNQRSPRRRPHRGTRTPRSLNFRPPWLSSTHSNLPNGAHCRSA
jgi:hypothetical protein